MKLNVINKETTSIFVPSFSTFGRYECFMGENAAQKCKIIEQKQFQYFLLGIVFERQTKSFLKLLKQFYVCKNDIIHGCESF